MNIKGLNNDFSTNSQASKLFQIIKEEKKFMTYLKKISDSPRFETAIRTFPTRTQVFLTF